MVADIDIYRAANILFDPAAQLCVELDEKGDVDGVAVWRRIMRMVQELQNTEPDVPAT